MAREMRRLGHKASAGRFGPRELPDFAVPAEQVGFDTVVFSDHFQLWHSPFSFACWGPDRPRARAARGVLTKAPSPPKCAGSTEYAGEQRDTPGDRKRRGPRARTAG